MRRSTSWWVAAILALVGCGKSAPGPFHPTGNVAIGGGTHSYTSFTIPAGVTVTVSADAIVHASGDVSIAGRLAGDCVGIDLEGAGAIAITGAISNVCSTGTVPKDLVIHTAGGAKLSVGSAAAPAALDTSGKLDITNDPTLNPADFVIPPALRPAVPVAPVCAALADTVLTVATSAAPAPVHFTGAGIAPSGGALAFKWDFGDGASSTDQNRVHSYPPGRYLVALAVTGANGTCTSKLEVLVVDAATDSPTAAAGVSILGSGLVANAGDVLSFEAKASTAGPAALTWAWDFGDGANDSLATVQHAYAQPGRYPVTATVTTDGKPSIASVSIYVLPAIQHAARPRGAALIAASCAEPNFNAKVNDAKRPFGELVTFTSIGDVVIGAQTNVSGQNGAPGANASGENVKAGDGTAGGPIRILSSGTLTLCDGAVIRGGSGGDGGSATATKRAMGGDGGTAGPIEIRGGYGLDVSVGSGVSVIVGKGGRGGDATVIAPDHPADCGAGPAPLYRSASAVGGKGGDVGQFAFDFSLPDGLTVAGGPAGRSGDAHTEAGAGEDQIACGSAPVGKKGDDAWAESTYGGSIRVKGAVGAALRPGEGGNATAVAGRGGTANADLPAACSPATAGGGAGGKANAECKGPGISPTPAAGLAPCSANASGGRGGDAQAAGAGCDLCQDGSTTQGDGSAQGGPGGGADVRLPDNPAYRAASTATGGKGGSGNATGGNGGACSQCPSGVGHRGGLAHSAGGDGGGATGAGAQIVQGTGGAASATGGTGGAGASCCTSPTAGGTGGAGGAATATAGLPGGADSGGAGSGGAGGDGSGPGAGGAKGIGGGGPLVLADGAPGSPGNSCGGGQACNTTGNAGACGTFVCGESATARCNCGTPPAGTDCTLGKLDTATSGGIYAVQEIGKGASGTNINLFSLSARFSVPTGSAPQRDSAALSNINTIFGAAGQCVRWDYAGTFPATTNIDLGAVTATVGSTTLNAAKLSDLSYYASRTQLWTAAGQTVTLAASGSGAMAPFTVSAGAPAPFTLTAPTVPVFPAQMPIPTGADFAITWTGPPDGSSLSVTLAFDSNTGSAGSEVVCVGQGGSLSIPAALLSGFPASSTGVVQFTQGILLVVAGAGFTWNNQLGVGLVDAQGNLITNAPFKLTP